MGRKKRRKEKTASLWVMILVKARATLTHAGAGIDILCWNHSQFSILFCFERICTGFHKVSVNVQGWQIKRVCWILFLTERVYEIKAMVHDTTHSNNAVICINQWIIALISHQIIFLI